MIISVAIQHSAQPYNKGEASAKARAMLADLLQNSGIDCDSPVVLQKDDRGRPFFASEALRHDVDFNLSHTEKTVAVAIAIREAGEDAPRVGIDVEMPHPRIRKKQLAARFFAENEIRLLDESNDEERAFLSIWTRKEAYLKYLGTGLAGEMQTADTTEPSALTVTLLTYPLTESGEMLSLCMKAGVTPPKIEDFLFSKENP